MEAKNKKPKILEPDDEMIRKNITDFLNTYIKAHGTTLMYQWIDWIEQIKNQSNWKPTEQNIKDLEWCADLVQEKMGIGFHRLQVLIDELKKL